MANYLCGEPITKDRIQDEPWYSDYQCVCEVMCAGPNKEVDWPTFYEILPDGLEQAMAACRRYFKEFPGPPGWERPDDERLMRWVKSLWLTEEQTRKIMAMYEGVPLAVYNEPTRLSQGERT